MGHASRRWVFVVGFAALFAGASPFAAETRVVARAFAETDLPERRWVRTCVASLAGASTRQRESVGSALSPLGDQCVGPVLANLDVLKTDADWGNLAAALRIVGAASCADAIDAAKPKWAPANAERLAALVAALRGAPPVYTAVAPPEPDLAEKRWIKECAEAFASPAARVRLGAERAVQVCGARAVPVLLTGLDALKTEESWAAFERAVGRAGGWECVDQLEAARPKWPKAQVARLDGILDRLRELTSGDRIDPEVDAKVRPLLETYAQKRSISSRDGEIGEVRAYGRRAVSTLLELMRDGGGTSSLAYAASAAYEGLAAERDVPRLVRLLEDGVTSAATHLARFPGQATADAVVAAIGAGTMDFSVAEAVRAMKDDPRMGPAVVQWLAKFGGSGDHTVAAAAELAGRLRLTDAAPTLVDLLPKAGAAQTYQRIANALTDLGRKEGIEGLVCVVEGNFPRDPGGDAWVRSEAGKRLNNLSRSFAFRGTDPSGDPTQPGGVDTWEQKVDAACAAAAPQFRAWWDGVKDRIKFDGNARKWIWE